MSQVDPRIIEIMYAEALVAREQCAATVDELRARTCAALTILATTTAIFVAVATATTTATHASIVDKPLELAALSLFFLSAFGFSIVLMPIVTWSFWPDPRAIDFHASQGSDAIDVQLDRVNDIDTALNSDAKPIRRLQWLFIGAVVCFVAEFVLWILEPPWFS
jgi:hypothetical protein